MEQNIKRSRIANYILATAAIILLLAYPFQDYFIGGLLTHMAGAAFIGGLADWYAVTALFKKPLGISFKTALIPRSKERIAETARHMIEKELLTVDNMYSVLRHHPVVQTLLDYMRTEKGFQAAERVLGHILNTFLYTVDMQTLVQAFSKIGGKAIENVDIAPMMANALRIGLRGESGRDFLDFMILNMEELVQSDVMKGYIGDVYRASLQEYEKRNFFFAWAIKAALASDMFSPDTVATKLQKKAMEVLKEAQEPDSKQREAALKYLWKMTERIDFNDAWQERIESYKAKMYQSMVTRPDMKEAWQRYVSDPERQKRVCTAAAKYAIGKLEKWQQQGDNAEHLNRVVLNLISGKLEKLQRYFGETAEKAIMRYDANYLAARAQDSVWYDLQMIRVNGSLVGALLGTVIYLFMFFAKGGM